jgi:tetratricopeptide (TPR) repeat protein
MSLWRLVTEVDCHWTDKLTVLRPVLEQLSPREKQQEGPYAYLRGLFALAAGDTDAAADCFRRSVEADSSQRNADVYLLCMSAEAERIEPAVEFLLDHGRTGADVMYTALWIAEVLAERRSVNGCATLVHKTAEQIEASTEADSAVTAYLLGRACVDLGRMSDARKHLTDALECNPEYSPAKELLDKLAGLETAESEDQPLE